MNGDVYSSKIVVEDFSMALSIVYKASMQKAGKEVEKPEQYYKATRAQDVCNALHPTAARTRRVC